MASVMGGARRGGIACKGNKYRRGQERSVRVLRTPGMIGGCMGRGTVEAKKRH